MIEKSCSLLIKKELQKAIIWELCKKEVIDFTQSNIILKKIEEQIEKVKEKYNVEENKEPVIIEIPL